MTFTFFMELTLIRTSGFWAREQSDLDIFHHLLALVPLILPHFSLLISFFGGREWGGITGAYLQVIVFKGT